MVLRGEYDFVSNAAVAGWEYAFEKCRIKEQCPALSLATLGILFCVFRFLSQLLSGY